MLPPFAATSGPRDAKIAFVGEAWGEAEAKVQRPFMGASGQEFDRMLSETNLRRKDVFCTNVLALRPQNNNLESLCASRKELPSDYHLPPLSQGKYLRPEFLEEISRLKAELSMVQPNLVVCLGATATWALLRATNIGAIRGAITSAILIPGLKVLPTYHPAAVLRQWKWRPIVIADLLKAHREMQFPEIIRPERTVLVNPTLDELVTWTQKVLTSPPEILSIDIETTAKQISCIGFAPTKSDAIVVPFIDFTRPENSYWATPREETAAWECVRLLLHSNVPKLFQNGLYDLQYLYRRGFRPKNCLHDTMLLHHSLFPEMQKSLGFLGSIYTNEAAWKLMRNIKKDEMNKRDE